MGGVSMEWKEVRLGDIADVQTGPFGSQLHKSDYIAEGIPCIMPTNIGPHLNFIVDGIAHVSEVDANRLSRHLTEIGDIIYARRGDIEKCAYVTTNEEKWLCGTGCLKIRCNNEVNSRFIAYLLSTAECKKWITGNAVGTTMLNLSKGILSNLPLLVPSHEDQRRIASILSSLDRKIELNNKINADLEEMAQAIFKNWFVDFEPFKDGKFVDSELGMIPEGWKVISLNEILDNVSGYSYKGSELQSSNIAMATIKNFERKGGFKTEGYKEIVISKKIKETQFVNMFDVLVAHTDLTQNAEIVGNPAIVLSKGGYEKLIMSMDLTKVISKIDGVTNGLLYCILSTSRFKEHALGYVNGTTVLHMSKKAVPEYTCAFPKDINQIRDLCITLDSIYKRMAVTYDENSRLSLLRDTLLPRLMSGELEVPE